MCSLRVLIKHSCVEAHVGGVYLERVMRVPVMSVGVPFPCVSIGGSVWVCYAVVFLGVLSFVALREHVGASVSGGMHVI